MLSQLYQAQAAAPDSVEEANAMLASGQLQPITVLTGGGLMSTPDEGTAVTNDRIEPFDLTSENYDDKYPQEALAIVVTEKGIFSVRYTAPQTVSAVETENVRLLPFEEIKSVFDKNIVLTKGAGDLDLYIRIDHVRLGMMRIAQPNSRDFLVVPVWDFIGGSVTESEFTEHSDADYWNMIQDDPNVSYLTVNAINGAVISRSLGY